MASGGDVLFGPRTGYKLPGNRLQPELAPGPFADLVGGYVDQHESLPPSAETRVSYRDEEYGFRTWAEWLVADGATVAGEYTTGAAAGRPAVLEHAPGDGSVTYCGVWPNSDLADGLVVDLLDRAGVAHAERFPENVRIAARDEYVWVLNFGSGEIDIDIGPGASWRVGSPSIPGFGVGVVEAKLPDVSLQ